jgi:hypothetical protein
MSKVDEIKQQLAQRLDQQAARPPKTSVKTGTVAASVNANDSARRDEAVTTLPDYKTSQGRGGKSTPTEGVIKLSASLYNFDIECLDRIREFMRNRGVRNITDSEALRLACRAVKVDESFMDIYQEMTKQDRRRRK